MGKDYCTQNDGDCQTCSLVNYGRDCHNNPIDAPQKNKKLRGRAAALAAYNGHHGPVTIAAVEAGISTDLSQRLTGHEYGLVMSAVNAAYHRGKSDAGAELADGDLLIAAGRCWPMEILRDLTTETIRVTTWQPTTRTCSRGGNNDKYILRDGEYVRLSHWEVESATDQLYYRNDDTHTIVKYKGVEIDRLPYVA